MINRVAISRSDWELRVELEWDACIMTISKFDFRSAVLTGFMKVGRLYTTTCLSTIGLSRVEMEGMGW